MSIADSIRWRWTKARSWAVTEAFVDRHHDERRSLYLASWPRSGSTWLAQMLCATPKTRLVFEPSLLSSLHWQPGEPRVTTLDIAGPGDPLGDPGARLQAALEGRLRSRWVDQLTTARLAERRVVKDVNTIGALPAIAAAHPQVPVVLLVRHPIATCHSLLELSSDELGWSVNGVVADGARAAATEEQTGLLLLAEIDEWVRQHRWTLAHPALSHAHLIFYEDLVDNPNGELARLKAWLVTRGVSFAGWAPVAASRRPSATSFRRDGASGAQWVDSWADAYNPATIDEAVTRVARAGLGGLYGASSRPLVSPTQALRMAREASSGTDERR